MDNLPGRCAVRRARSAARAGENVLAEPEVAAADRIVLTGDLAAGPQPRRDPRPAGLARGPGPADAAGTRTVSWSSSPAAQVHTVPDPVAPWAAAQLRADQAGLLAGLPLDGKPPGDRAGPGAVLPRHPPGRRGGGRRRLPARALGRRARLRRPGGGRGGKGTPTCRSAWWSPRAGGQPGQRRDAVRPARHTGRCSGQGSSCGAPCSTRAACARIAAQSSYPDAAEWADFYLNARATDAEALAVMAPGWLFFSA